MSLDAHIRATCPVNRNFIDFATHTNLFLSPSVLGWKVLNIFKLDLPPYLCLSTSFLLLLHNVSRLASLEGVDLIFTSNLYNGLYCHSQIKCQYEVTGGAAVANLSIRRLTSLEVMTLMLLTQRRPTRECFFASCRKTNVCRLMGWIQALQRIYEHWNKRSTSVWLVRPVARLWEEPAPSYIVQK